LQSSATKPPLAAAVKHEAKPHHHVAGESLLVDGDGPLAGDVDDAVEEDPTEREAGEGNRGRRHEALLHERVDAERGGGTRQRRRQSP
jgi:hypothetical protein